MVDICHSILMIVVGKVRLKNFIDKIKRINGLKKFKVLASIQLPYISFRSIKQHALFEFFRPYHLHLNKKLPALLILAPDINNTVLFQWCFRYKFYGNILNTFDLMLIIKRQKSIKQTDDEIRMFSENSFERKICTWV